MMYLRITERTPGKILRSPKAVVFTIAAVAAVIIICFMVSRSHVEQPIVIPKTETAAQAYSEAVSLLDAGKSTPRAIALLKYALAREPNNPDFHSALACAYTARAAVLYRALCFQEGIKEARRPYFRRWAQWEVDRFNPNADDFYSPRPIDQPTHVIPLKDDGTPFKMSKAHATDAIVSLYLLSEEQWQGAESSAKTAKQSARVHYLHGWSNETLSYFRRDSPFYGDMMPYPSSLPSDFPRFEQFPTNQSALSEFKSAVDLDPTQDIYFESAGDLVYEIIDSPKILATENSLHPKLITRQSTTWYVQALRRNPNNASLCLKLACAYDTNSVAYAQYIESGGKCDKHSAYMDLLVIDELLRKTHFEENASNSTNPNKTAATAAMVKSLTAADLTTARQAENLLMHAALTNRFAMIGYRSPVALELIPSMKLINEDWAFEDGYNYVCCSDARDAARDISGIASAEAMNGHYADGVRLLQTLAKAVAPACGDDRYTETAVKSGFMMDTLIASSIQGIAVHGIARLESSYGTTAEASAANKEWKSLDSHRRKESKSIQRFFHDPNSTDCFAWY